jgi:hypothetical protein
MAYNFTLIAPVTVNIGIVDIGVALNVYIFLAILGKAIVANIESTTPSTTTTFPSNVAILTMAVSILVSTSTILPPIEVFGIFLLFIDYPLDFLIPSG